MGVLTPPENMGGKMKRGAGWRRRIFTGNIGIAPTGEMGWDGTRDG